jgi:methylase of polypeptide subunit release factors
VAMLNQLPVESSNRLRAFFNEAGYAESNLRKHLGAAELPSERLRNHARLLDRTSAPTGLNLLLRWFWLGIPQDARRSAELIPDEIIALMLESRLLAADEGMLAPRAMMLPIEEFLVAADFPFAIERKQAELVLWPNPTSKFLGRFAVSRHSRATLDLGTGSGILSLGASRYSDAVVSTDLNSRAVDCARFNARLNGIENIEVLEGDCFAPVEGRQFDLILSNPPFFITPQTDYMFCDNPMDLDGLCRRLVKECPEHLNEGGYMQMLCEWAQIKGQPWEERIAEWLQGTGCDAWVMKGVTQDPEEYAQHRIRETSPDPSQDSESYGQYMDYYRRSGVQAIHDGLIVMRRRSGQNFVRIEVVPPAPSGNLGEMILSTFAAHDLLRENASDEKLLRLSPRLADHVRLEQTCIAADAQWKAEALNLRLTSGFPFHVAVQPLVAEFLVTCDGTRTMGSAIQDFAAKLDTPRETVQAECISMIRKLIERGIMTAV